jgi:hypothetical protein
MGISTHAQRQDCEGPHYRHAWNEDPALRVRPHSYWTLVANGGGGDHGSAAALKQHYAAAKKEFSVESAIALILHYFNERAMDGLFDDIKGAIMRELPLIVVHPTPKFQDVDHSKESGRYITNALPSVLAGIIAKHFGAIVDESIIQTARPGRTVLNRIQRFLYQPRFEGAVDPKAVYILVDDAYTLGGTLATLRSHIVGNGGTVGAVCVLCNKTGSPVPFAISDTQVSDIHNLYGLEVEAFWREKVGHDVRLLTYNEGAFLGEWSADRLREGASPPLLQRLRERFDSARATGK